VLYHRLTNSLNGFKIVVIVDLLAFLFIRQPSAEISGYFIMMYKRILEASSCLMFEVRPEIVRCFPIKNIGPVMGHIFPSDVKTAQALA
jgi:hypothetical protein